MSEEWKTLQKQNNIIIDQNKLIVDHIKVVNATIRATLEFQKDLIAEIFRTQTATMVGLTRLGAGDLTEYLKPKKEAKPDAEKQSEASRNNTDETGEVHTNPE